MSMARLVSRQDVLAAARHACTAGRRPTMEEVASAAGVAVRTLYRLFASHEALLREAGCAPSLTAREQVLDTALELVGRRGLADLSLDELAAAAGTSRATVYRLFPGKPALFAELVRVYSPWTAVSEAIDAVPDGRPAEVVPAVGRAIARAMQGRAGLVLRIVHELTMADSDTAEGVRHGMARGLPDVIRYLDRQMEAGRLRRMDPVVAFQLLAGPIVIHLLTRPLAESLGGLTPAPGEVVDQVVEAWLRAMAPDEETGGSAGE